MNYSAYHSLILQRYLVIALVIIGFSIACLIGLVKLIVEHKRDKKEFDYTVVIVVSIMMSVVYYMSGWRYIMDIPNVFNQKYEIATGSAIDSDLGGTEGEERSVRLRRDDNGEVLVLYVIGSPIQKGDRLSVIYLQYSGIGAIVRRSN